LANPDQLLRAGLSAQLDIKTSAINGHLVPASTILLNDFGQTVIRVLDEQHIAKTVGVNVVGETQKGVWVTGLPAKAVIVTVGQNYIIDGESVEPVYPANEAP
jgi:multidrug efflux system membrane fusion protein